MMGDFVKQRLLRCLAAALGLSMALGCASVRNYDTNGQRIGFEHYAGKHYLLVEPGKDGTQVLKVITLPDLSEPRYIKRKAGWGSLQFSFKLQNGVLTEFGTTQDSKGAETLATLGTLGTAYGALLAAGVTAAGTVAAAEITAGAGAGAVPGAPPSITIKTLMDIAAKVQTKVVDPLATATDQTLTDVRANVGAEVGNLQTAAALDPKKEIIKEIQEAQKTTGKIVRRLETEEGRLKAFLQGLQDPTLRSLVSSVVTDLSSEITALKKFALSARQPALYEILPRSGGGIEFQRVDLS